MEWLDGEDEAVGRTLERPSGRALLLGLGIFALIVALVVAWLLLRPAPTAPSYPVVEGLGRPPVVWFASHDLTSEFPVSGHQSVLRQDPDTGALTLLDLRSGDELWTRPTERWIYAGHAYPANDRLVALHWTEDGSGSVVMRLSDGEVVAEREGIVGYTTAGTPHLFEVDWVTKTASLSLLSAEGLNPVWTVEVPVDLDHANGVVWIERDGYLMASAGATFYAPALHQAAISIEDGSPAPWMADGGLEFQPLGEGYLVSLSEPVWRHYEYRDSAGEAVWEHRGVEQLVVLDGQVYSFKPGSGAIERLTRSTARPSGRSRRGWSGVPGPSCSRGACSRWPRRPSWSCSGSRPAPAE